MPNQNTTGSGEQQQKQSDSGNWLFAGAVGAAIGAGLAYFLTKETSQTQRCGSRNSSSSNNTTFEAAPRGCCSICRDDYDATITLSCGHILHKDCYEQMRLHSKGHVLCPLCRKQVA